MGEHDFNLIQTAVLRNFADEEVIRNPIFYKGEFREDEWFSLLNSGELISKNALRNQEGIGGYLRIGHQIDRLGWATPEQIENCRWAITPEGLERVRKEIEKNGKSEWVPYTLVPKREDKITYTLDKLKILWQAYQWQLAHDLPDFRTENFIEFIGKLKEIVYSPDGLIDHIVYKEVKP